MLINFFAHKKSQNKNKYVKKYYFQILCLKLPVLGGGSFKACQELAMIG